MPELTITEMFNKWPNISDSLKIEKRKRKYQLVDLRLS